jgi:glutamine amidotransferase
MKIVIVDYGMGNIRSIVGALKHLGVNEISISSDFEEIRACDKLVLPGVGSFGKAMNQIKEKQLDKSLYQVVVKDKKPILGICLGMQLLGISSTEDGFNDGLKFVNGDVTKFDSTNLKVPHVGFNQVVFANDTLLYKNFPPIADFYFTHSYKMHSTISIKQSFCDYGGEFTASFEVDNITGVQFHPELSQNNGLKLLKNFINNF